MRPVKTDQTGRMRLRWAHSHFVGFVMSQLICTLIRMSKFDQKQLVCIIPGITGWIQIKRCIDNLDRLKNGLNSGDPGPIFKVTKGLSQNEPL